MVPDIKFHDFYLQFIHSAKEDAIEYKNKLEEAIGIRDNLYDWIAERKSIIKEKINLNLNDYKIEWELKEYNKGCALYGKAFTILKQGNVDNYNITINQIIKYCLVLKSIDKYNRLLKLASKRSVITFGTYRNYVSKYYNKVHKCVLEGFGYRFQGGIGTYVINHWKLDPQRISVKPRIDYAATNARKKELQAKGIKLYDDKEAAWYAARKIPYNAVDYRVYKTSTDWYEINFIKSSIVKRSSFDYKKTEYVASKYRGMSYKEIADTVVKNIDDIYDLQVDIKYKLNILLYLHPNKYLNFVRNAEQDYYKPGAHNS